MDINRRQFITLTGGGAAILTFARQPAQAAKGQLKVVTSTEDMAALAREVGGDRISVESLGRGYQDSHFVEPKPSFISKVHGADLLISVGLQLEIGWLPPLITQSRNPRVQPGAAGYLEGSQFADVLEKPAGGVSRSMGDVHPLGNPHFWLDPKNGRAVALGIANKLSELKPEDAAYFAQRYKDFDTRLAAAEKGWDQKMAPYRGRKVITFHQSWPNFAKRFGIEVAGYIEPKPGIPPTPSHTLALIGQMKSQNIKVIWVEPYFDTKVPNSIANAVGGEAIVLLPSVGGVPQASDYIKLFDYDVNLAAGAFQRFEKHGS
jgi:zinc/manganese transport system substrate-binding protein